MKRIPLFVLLAGTVWAFACGGTVSGAASTSDSGAGGTMTGGNGNVAGSRSGSGGIAASGGNLNSGGGTGDTGADASPRCVYGQVVCMGVCCSKCGADGYCNPCPSHAHVADGGGCACDAGYVPIDGVPYGFPGTVCVDPPLPVRCSGAGPSSDASTDASGMSSDASDPSCVLMPHCTGDTLAESYMDGRCVNGSCMWTIQLEPCAWGCYQGACYAGH